MSDTINITMEQALKWFNLTPNYDAEELYDAYHHSLDTGRFDEDMAFAIFHFLSVKLYDKKEEIDENLKNANTEYENTSEAFREQRRETGKSRMDFMKDDVFTKADFEANVVSTDPFMYKILHTLAQHFPYRFAFLLIGLACWNVPWGISNLITVIAWINLMFPILTNALRDTLIKMTFVTRDIFEDAENARSADHSAKAGSDGNDIEKA